MKHVITSFFAMFVLLAVSAPVQAQPYPFVETDRVEMPELEPGAPVEGKLGSELAMSGNTVFAAAPQAFDFEGAVFVFELDDNGILQFRERLATESSTYKFGNQLTANGDWAAVGQIGSIRMYQRSGAGWVQRQLIELSDVVEPADINVRSLSGDLALSRDLLVVGDSSAHVTSGGTQFTGAGAVVLFRRNATGQWLHEATLASDTPAGSAGLGTAVAASGDTALAGAPGQEAVIFERSGSQWQVARHLDPPEPAGSYGRSVALDGDLAVVGRGTGFTGDGLPSNIGSFLAYERDLGGAGQWGLRDEYISSQPGYIDNFSVSLSLHGKVLLVGATTGRVVYFAHRPGAGFEEVAILDLDDTVDPYGGHPNFGKSVAFSGLRTVIGAPNSPDADVGGTPGPERWGSIHAWTPLDGGECGHLFFPLDTVYCDGFESLP